VVRVRRQVLLIRFEPRATQPEGNPPSFDVTAGAGTVTLLEGDDAGVPSEASYTTHVTMTGESTFDEHGELTVDGGGLRLQTVGSGTIQPSAEEGTVRGAVTWQVEGTGRWNGATGLLSSNFAFQPATGAATEHQILRLFLP
jgi:hypothetical protein